MVERRSARKRDYRAHFCSLDDSSEYTDGTNSKPELFDKDSYLMATQGIPYNRMDERIARRIDLERAIQRLSSEQRELAEQLSHRSLSEVSRATGIPRTTLNDRRKVIQREFAKMGLEDWLK